MSPDEHKVLYRGYLAAIQAKNPDELEAVLAPTFGGHDLPPGLPSGPKSLKYFRQMVAMAFPDQKFVLADLVAEGDRVVGRFLTSGTHQGEFMRIPGTGKHIAVEVIEVVGIAERRVQWDKLSALQQMGVHSLPEQS